MGKQIKNDFGFVPDDQEIITEPVQKKPATQDFGFVPDPVKKKVLSTDQPVSDSPSTEGSSTPAAPSPKPGKKDTSTSLGFIDSIKQAAKELKEAYQTPATEKKIDPFINAIERGSNLADQAIRIGPFSDKPTKETIKEVADLQKAGKNLPGSKAYTDFTQAKTFGEAAKTFASDPVKVLVELTAESITSMLKYGAPRIAAGAGIGAGLGAPVLGVGIAPGGAGGALVGMADTSYGLEFTGKFLESLQEAGVDTSDPKALELAFQDDAVIDAARTAANKKAIPIALFDLVSGGIAGKIVSKPAKSIAGKIGAGAAEMAAQSLMGAAGETAGQLVAGEKIQPGAIMAEALGETAMAPVEVGLGMATNKNPIAAADTQAEIIDQTLNQDTNALPIESSSTLPLGSTARSGEAVESGVPESKPEEVAGEENNTQKILDEQQGMEGTSSDTGRSEEAEGTTGEGGTVLPESVQSGAVEEPSGSTTEGDVSDQTGQGAPSGSDEPRQQQSIDVQPESDSSGLSKVSQEEVKPQTPQSDDTSPSTPPGQQPAGAGKPPSTGTPPPTKPDQPQGGDERSRTYAIAERIEKSDANPAIKKGIKEKGDKYIPKGIDITDSEAKNLIELYGEDKSESLIRDTKNDLTGDTRTALAARLYESYKNKGDESTDPNTKQIYYDKAVDVALTSAEQLKEAGRQTNAAKIWKAILSSGEDMIVMAYEKQAKRAQERALMPVQEQMSEGKNELDDQIKKIIEQRVQEGVEERLKRAKLITKEKRQQISDAFDRLKIKTPKGTIQATTLLPEVYNGAIEAVKQAVLTGANVANAIQAGVDYIRDNYKGNWDEQQYRHTVKPVVEQQYNSVLNTKERAEERQVQALKKSIDKLNKKIQEGDLSVKKRESKIQSEEISRLRKERDDLQKKLNKMRRDALKASQINEKKIKTPKLSGKRKKNFINELVDLYNEKGEITDADFESLYAKQLGIKELSSEDRAQLRKLASIVVEAEKFQEVVKNNFTRGGLAKYKDLFRKAQIANRDMQIYARDNRNLTDTWITMMQGNLLTPLSLVTNVYSNVLLQNLRFASTIIGSGIDLAQMGLAKLGVLGEAYKKPSIHLPSLQKGYFAGEWDGLMEGVYQTVYGALPSEGALREITSGFSPKNAIKRWSEKDRTLGQKINDAVEGTIGWEAEVMFRLLNLGDKPFRRAAELAKAHELAKSKGLKGQEAAKFMAFPDAKSAEIITKAGDDATFQGSGPKVTYKGREIGLTDEADKTLRKWLDIVGSSEMLGTTAFGKMTKLLAKSQIPYVRTPLNITFETLDYAAWPVTLLRSISEISKGNRRDGNILFGKAVVGYAIMTVAKALFLNGLLTGEEKDKKERSLQYDTVPPNSLNIEALIRGLLGQGFEIKDEDIWINTQKMGVHGILFDNYARTFEERQKKGESLDFELANLPAEVLATAPNIVSSSLNQSFLSGTSTMLEALKEGGGKMDNLMVSTVGALSSPVIPNTVAAISKASDEYIRDTRNDNLWQRIKNEYKNKLFKGNKLPALVNLWGEKIKGNPEGRDKISYYLWDTTKFKEVDTDDWRYKLYKAWRDDKSEDASDYIPAEPQRKVQYRGVPIKLKPDEFAKFAEKIGKQRAILTKPFVESIFSYLSPEQQRKELKKIYDRAYEYGKESFLMEQEWSIMTTEALMKLNER